MLALWLLPLELLTAVQASTAVTPTPTGSALINFSNALPTHSAAPFLPDNSASSFVQPLYRRQHARARRRSPIELSDWALREKQRIQGKYLGSYGDGLSPLQRRQQTAADVSDGGAYYASTRSSNGARATATGRNAVGRVNLTNYLADLCVSLLTL